MSVVVQQAVGEGTGCCDRCPLSCGYTLHQAGSKVIPNCAFINAVCCVVVNMFR